MEDSKGVWADELVVRPDGQHMARFTAVRAWQSVGSAKVWYEKVIPTMSGATAAMSGRE